MEGERFDHLTRRLGQGRTRRTVLSLVAGLLGGSLSARLAPAPVAAACRRLNQSCKKKRPRNGKRGKCCSGLVCRNKRCRIKECTVALGCGEGRGCCEGTCVDLQTDAAHCGGCGNACPAGTTCIGGACRSCQADGETCQFNHDCCNPPPWFCIDGLCRNLCHPDLTWCGDTCVNLNFDQDNCGACGNACDADASCLYGRCQAPGCVLYGEECSTSAECCLLNDGTHIPCNGGLCRFN